MNTAIVDKWLNVIDKTRELIAHHVPLEVMPNAVVLAGLFLAVGLLLGIFGARFSKGILSVLLGSVGALIGLNLANHYDQRLWIGAAVGFIVLGLVAFYTHRLWVGIAVGLVASSLALAWFGHETVLNEYHSYVFAEPGLTQEAGSFSVPDASAQPTGAIQKVWSQAKGFYDHFRTAQPATSQRALGVTLLCLLGGFVFGICCTRWALILACAALATVIINAGLGTLAERFVSAGWENRVAEHPYAALGFVATCFVLSALVQTRLTSPRTPPPEPVE